jgi:DNA-binding response OmpR family regulator
MAKRILIADDSLTIQKAFAMTFAGEDVTLLAARSADEGLTLARQGRPELVIADAVMPGRSGYDLCAAIKSDPALKGVPVYILASVHNPYDDNRGRQSGADGQFTKPFDSVALVERVREAIAKGTTAVARPVLSSVAPIATPPARAHTPAPVPMGSSAVDDDYGEITIEASRAGSPASRAAENTPPPRAPLFPAQQRPSAPAVTPAAIAATSQAGLRPSLIPGLRPGAPPPARPGMTMQPRPAAMPGAPGHAPVSSAPVAHFPAQAPGARGPGPHMVAPSASQVGPARTLVGLPSTVTQAPPRFGAPAAPVRPPTQPVRPLDARTPAPIAHAPVAPVGAVSPSAFGAITSKVDQKVAEISAPGPEYEAIAKLSREIIEKIVWEVVPELAEVILREELQKRGRI